MVNNLLQKHIYVKRKPKKEQAVFECRGESAFKLSSIIWLECISTAVAYCSEITHLDFLGAGGARGDQLQNRHL